MKLRFGARDVEFPRAGLVDEMEDSASLLGDPEGLRERLGRDGYLLLRGFHPAEEIEAARLAILAHLAAAGALAADAPPSSARCRPGEIPPNMKGQRAVTHHPSVARILEGERVTTLFGDLFAGSARTFDYKWLRATPPGEFTGVHADAVYMGRGSARLLSCWVPFGEVTPALGSIALCVGSDRSAAYASVRETYGRSDSDRDGYGGWLTLDPLELVERYGGSWHTTTFAPGDVLIFGMQMLHASFANATNEYRLSCDTRFQPAADPVDERWVGDGVVAPKGTRGPHVATDAMRRAWGI